MAGRMAKLWAIKVLVTLLGGVLLAVLSVPTAAFVSQRWGAFSGNQPRPIDSKLIWLDDGEWYLLIERRSTRKGLSGTPRLMRYRVGVRVHPDGELADTIDPTRYAPQPDTRPAFLRRPPPLEYTEVRCYSSGWPWHAGYSRDLRDPSVGFAGRRATGEARLTIGSRDYVLPYLPHWPGPLGNTAFYAALVFLPWPGYRWARSARRRRHGRCLVCSYPLDGDMTECPECGTPNKHRLQTPTLAMRPLLHPHAPDPRLSPSNAQHGPRSLPPPVHHPGRRGHR